MMKIQTNADFAYIYDTITNKVVRSEHLPNSGSTTIAITKLITWAKKNGMRIN